MKLIAISDLHGNLPVIEDDFDLMVICGDICPTFSHGYQFQKEWLEDDFVSWINSLNFKDNDSKVIFIGGNHDFFLEREGKHTAIMFNTFVKPTNGRLIYLHNELYTFQHFNENNEIKSYNIFGTPYCDIFGNWAFMRSEDILEKKFAEIPQNLDILLCHDSPKLKEIGTIHDGIHQGTDAGNKCLANEILKKKPKYVFSGHIHTGYHDLTEIDGIKLYNVSILNENYELVYYPLTLEL